MPYWSPKEGHLLVVCQCGNGFAHLPIELVGTTQPDHCAKCQPKRRGKDKNDRRTSCTDRTAASCGDVSERDAQEQVRVLPGEGSSQGVGQSADVDQAA